MLINLSHPGNTRENYIKILSWTVGLRIRKQKVRNPGEDAGDGKPSCTARGSANWRSYYRTLGRYMEPENSQESEVIPTQKQKHTYSHSYVDPIVKVHMCVLNLAYLKNLEAKEEPSLGRGKKFPNGGKRNRRT